MEKYVLVTGASSGIGRAVAISLSENYRVILHGRNLERLNEVKNICSLHNECLVWQEDLEQVEMLEGHLQNFLLENEAIVEGYVHCAGLMKMLPLKSQSLINIQQTFCTNVISAMLITKVLSSRKWNKGGLHSIVFISSNISNRGAKAFNIYASSKGALDAFMRSMAIELAPNVRVNSILPGAVCTDMTTDIFANKQVEERMKVTYPLGFGYPQDIADGVKFLLSEQARWITGQQIVIDGGRTIDITG